MKSLDAELPSAIAAHVSDLLLGLGAGAVSEEKKRDGRVLLRAYFHEETDIGEVTAAAVEFSAFLEAPGPPPIFTSSRVKSEDWENWKSFLGPVRASRRVTVKPPWKKCESAPGGVAVEINPARAFGTGHHETTRICLEYLDDILERFKGCSVLDLGCGSGVLAISAVRLGAGVAFCADTDFTAAVETFSNSARNSVNDRTKIWCGSIQSARGKFDVIVCNTSKSTLVSLRDSIMDRLSRRGFLIVSGVLESEIGELADIYESSGYDVVDRRTEGEWAGALLRPKSKDGKRT